jgi:ferrous iron transport protein B
VPLYFPCAAATGAIFRETTTGWTLFRDRVDHRAGLRRVHGRLPGRHVRPPPGSSAGWIAGALLALGLTLAGMRLVGNRRRRPRRIVHEPPAGAPGSFVAAESR